MAPALIPEIITQKRQDMIDNLPEARYHFDYFDEYIAEHGLQSFMVMKVGGEIIDNNQQFSALCRALETLHGYGYVPVVVHGGGPQINRALGSFDPVRINGSRVTYPGEIGIIARTLEEVSDTIVDGLAVHNVGAIALHGIIEADYIDPSIYGEVGEITHINREAITSVVEAGKIPIISCLGKLTCENKFLNINGDTAAAAVVETVRALKYMAISDMGGILGHKHEVMHLLTPTIAQTLIADGTITEGMKKKVEDALDLLRRGAIEDFVVVGPGGIRAELFTHEGIGTLITSGAELREYTGNAIKRIEERHLVSLIQTAFKAKLTPESYFANPAISKIILTVKRFEGVAIFMNPRDTLLEEHGVLYMDKLAIAEHARGRGLAKQIIEQATNQQGIFWRASPTNPYLTRYLELADGEQRVTDAEGEEWYVFWRNVPKGRKVRKHIVQYASDQPLSLLRNVEVTA